MAKKEKSLSSKELARERLSFALSQDRACLKPDMMEKMCSEIKAVIENYMEIDEEKCNIQIAREKSEDGKILEPYLKADIKIKKIKAE